MTILESLTLAHSHLSNVPVDNTLSVNIWDLDLLEQKQILNWFMNQGSLTTRQVSEYTRHYIAECEPFQINLGAINTRMRVRNNDQFDNLQRRDLSALRFWFLQNSSDVDEFAQENMDIEL